MSRGRSKTVAGVVVSQTNVGRDQGVVRRNNEDQASASDGLYSVDSRRLEPAIKGKRGTTNRAVGFALAERQAERRTRSFYTCSTCRRCGPYPARAKSICPVTK